MNLATRCALLAVVLIAIVTNTAQCGSVIGWGDDSLGQATPPTGLYNIKAIAAGGAHGVAVKGDGEVFAWGDTSTGSITPPSGLSGVTAVAAGDAHFLALKSDGSVVQWGDDTLGQSSPPEGLASVTAIAAGAYHSLALKSDGTVVQWGDTSSGQGSPPVDLTGVVAIGAGYYHSLAVKSDGTVIQWGDDTNGQASPPAGLTGVIKVAAGYVHSLALKSDGTVVCWGDDTYGQTSPPSALSGITAVAAGVFHSLALKSDGTVVQWGDTSNGQSNPPSGLSEVSAIAAGGCFSLALKDGPIAYAGPDQSIEMHAGSATIILDGRGSFDPDGDTPLTYVWKKLSGSVVGTNARVTSSITHLGETVFRLTVTDTKGVSASDEVKVTAWSMPLIGWGHNSFAQATPPSGLSEITAIAAGVWHSLALRSNGTVVGWGGHILGQATPPAGLSNVVAISAGYAYSLALKSDGTVVWWGDTDPDVLQTQPPSDLADVIAISAGFVHCLALKSDHTVVQWGGNTIVQGPPPAGLSDVIAIATGFGHSLALKSDGTVVQWGPTNTGQGSPPVGLNDVVAIAAGDYHSLALKSDGTVVAWGNNEYGQIDLPSGLSGVVAIAAGGYHNLALKSDGTVIGWGADWYQQSTPPMPLHNVTAIAAGLGHSLALCSGKPFLAADAGPDQNIKLTESATPITLDGSNSFDGGSGPLTYTWEDASGNRIGDQAITIFPVSQTGTYKFRLIVTDQQGLTSSDTLTVKVWPNGAPTISVGFDGVAFAAGDKIEVIAYVGESSCPLASVVADGLALVKQSGYWNGYIYASSVMGEHDILATATDIAGDVATYRSIFRYKTVPVVATTARSARDPIIQSASFNWVYKFCGKVISSGPYNLTLDDGSGKTISVTCWNTLNTLAVGEYASVQGILKPYNPASLEVRANNISPNIKKIRDASPE